MVLERFPHKPYIKNLSKNVTALVNTTAEFECQVASDLEAHIQWIKGITWNEEEDINQETLDRITVKVGIFVVGTLETD